MAMNIDNCPRCGKIFVKGFREVCPQCMKEVEAEYDRCYKYLRENRGCTSNELSEATEVSVKQITKFIREGRISLTHAPNLGYPCESCGTIIREHTVCNNCRNRLTNEVRKAIEDTATTKPAAKDLNNEPRRQAGFQINASDKRNR